MWTGVGIIAGGLITIVVALAVEWVKRPRLAVEVAGSASDPRWEILHVKVINKPVGGWWGRLLLRTDARGCRVQMRFAQRGVTGPPLQMLPQMPGRWSATPQPLTIVPDRQGHLTVVFDINRVPQTQRFDLQPDDAGEAVAVAIKHGDDKKCYAFNSESDSAWAERLDFRHPRFELGTGQFDVTVTATVGGIKPTTERFLLTCDSTGFFLK